MPQQSEDLVFSTIKGESIPFAIGDSSVIIDIIRKRIYSHPIRTLVGEYLSNGRDACVEAEKECRIDVTLPTLLLPEFTVRDYGVGMSDERVREVFVRYGISTKRESKSQLGYFGIGAKSGWAYSDSFIVESYYEGSHREYIADIGENKEGRLLLFKETRTEEENGVRIRIPVNPSDVDKFLEAYRRATFLWDVKPSLILDGRITYPELFLDLGSVRIFKSRHDLGIPLVLDANGMPFDVSDDLLVKLCRDKHLVLAIKADPAKLSISANREGFSNAEYATRLVNKAKATLSSHIDKEFEKASFSEHRKVYSEMSFLRDFRTLSNKPYSFTEHSFFVNHKSYFFIIQYRKPTEKCIIREYKFNLVEEIFLCRSKSLEKLSPETKKALRAAKSERTADSRTLLFFQLGLTDDEYKESAEVIGADSYLEDIYAGRTPVKIVAVPVVKQPKVTYVRTFVRRYYFSKNITTGPAIPLADCMQRAVVFYGEACSVEIFNFLSSLKPILNYSLISIAPAKRDGLVEIADPKFIHLDNWKCFFTLNPSLLDTIRNLYSIKTNSNVIKLLKVFGDRLHLPQFDVKKMNAMVEDLGRKEIRIDSQFYLREFTHVKTELDLLAEKYMLLTNFPDPSYIRDRNTYLDHINIYLRGVEPNA